MGYVKRLLMKAPLARGVDLSIDGVRTITASDINELGEVMYEAYLGTTDYGGESIQDAQTEIAETLQGKYGRILENACLVIEADGRIVSAIIFNWYEKENMPLLTFTMTRASQKGKGFAKKLLNAGLSLLAKDGFTHCCLFVTEGNEPAVSIYKSLGFKD